MSNANQKNTERVGRNVKPLISLDWTKPEGETPFFVPRSGSVGGYYGVAVDTGVNQYNLVPSNKVPYKEDGLSSILDFYNKDSDSQAISQLISYAVIPGENGTPEEEAQGLYVPLRPASNIKVLVTIPEILPGNFRNPVEVLDTFTTFGGISSVETPESSNLREESRFSDLPEKKNIAPAVYDEIQLNTYGLEKKVSKVSQLLENYNSVMLDFEGKVYNADLAKEAERFREFIPILRDLVRTNGYLYSESQSDLIMMGMSGSGLTGSTYLPQYAQINQGSSFRNLSAGFSTFSDSMFITSNTMYLYKHLEEITHIAQQRPTVKDNTGSAPMGWETFIDEFIKFPPPVIEYTSGRPRSPDPKAQMETEIKKVNSNSAKDAKALSEESWRLKSKQLKKEMNDFRKQSKDFVGDTVVGNLNKTINTINTIEDVYYHYLNKFGITYIVKAAVECLNLDLPIDEIKSFLLDVNRFAGEVVKILKIPVISLDDIIPTVDIMGDIVEQILLSIAEAVKKALISMVKQVIMMYLEACGDPCKLNFGGLPIGKMLSEGNTAGVVAGALGVMGENVGGAVLDGMKAGIVSPGISQQSRKFLSNLQSHVTDEQVDKLTAPLAQPASQVQQAAGPAVQQATQLAVIPVTAQAITQSPIGSFLDTLGSTLTCGEVNKMLQGKTTKDTVKIVQSTADQMCAINPEIYGPLCDLLGDEDKINDFFGNVGKLVDEGEIQKQIDNFEDLTPILATSLCDEDDNFLRCELLEGKGITSLEVCNAQINASRERAKSRINELAEILDKEDPLDGVVPPVYCTIDADGNFVEGLIKQDHSSYTFMMDRVLDTTFDGIYNSFITDISSVPSLLSPRVLGEGKDVPRLATVNNKEIINPEFRMLYDQGQRPTAGNPFWESNDIDPKKAQEDTVDENRNGTPIKAQTFENVFLPGMAETEGDKNVGVYTNFQTSLLYDDFMENRDHRDLLNSRSKILQFTIEDSLSAKLAGNTNPSNNLNQIEQVKEYVKDELRKSWGGFGTSPDDLNNEQTLDGILGDVFSDSTYALFYTQFSEEPITGKENFAVSIQAGQQNVIWSKGFQQSDIPIKTQEVIEEKGLGETQLSPVNVPPLDPTRPPKTNSDFSLVERRFAEFLSNSWNLGESIYTIQDLGEIRKLPISERPGYANAIGNIIQTPGGASAHSLDPNTLLQIQGQNILSTGNQGELVGTLYDELLRGLQAMCLRQVSESPLLKDNIFQSLNLTPQPCVSSDPSQEGNDNSLLDLTGIKNKLKEVYDMTKCIEPTMPNVCGTVSNKDNALEQSILYGLVQTTARVYALEAIIKSAPTFSMLSITDIDEVFVEYVSTQAIEEIKAKFYLNSFLSQCLKSYNSLPEHQSPNNLSDPRKAFNWFVKNELAYAVTEILKLASLPSSPQAVDDLLFSAELVPNQIAPLHWLPQFNVSSSTPQSGNAGISYKPALQRLGQDYRLGDYGVASKEDIIGLKDWREGNIYLETYIRVEYKDNKSVDSTSAFPPPKYAPTYQPEDLPFDNRGVVDKNLFSTWMNGEFFSQASMPIIPTTPVRLDSTIIAADDCAEQEIVIPRELAPLIVTAPDPQKVGSYIKSLRYGLRLVCQVVNDTADNSRGIPNQPFHQAMQNNYDINNTKLNKSYHYKEEAYAQRIDAYTIPIVCVEKDLPLDIAVADISNDPNYFSDGYNSVYPELVTKIKETPEYSFIFDYCFPMNRLVSLTALYGITYSLPFPGLSNAFLGTKEQLRMSFSAVANSGDYKSRDLVFTNKGQANAAINGADIPGFDFSIIEQFFWGILKGAGESFDPNIAVAKKIKDAMELVGPALTSAINKGKSSAGRLQGQSEEEIRKNQITECDLNLPEIDIPMLLISFGLLPINIFGVPPAGIGIGPPITGLGAAYLAAFGHEELPGSRALKTADQKKRDRCNIKKLNGPDLTGKDDCSGQPSSPSNEINPSGKDECD